MPTVKKQDALIWSCVNVTRLLVSGFCGLMASTVNSASAHSFSATMTGCYTKESFLRAVAEREGCWPAKYSREP